MLILTLIVDAVGTVLVYIFERGVRGGDIHTFGDALFFTTVQLLTVSSQIRNPLTPAGRIVDVLLEVWAVIVVAGSAGAWPRFFHGADRWPPAARRESRGRTQPDRRQRRQRDLGRERLVVPAALLGLHLAEVPDAGPP